MTTDELERLAIERGMKAVGLCVWRDDEGRILLTECGPLLFSGLEELPSGNWTIDITEFTLEGTSGTFAHAVLSIDELEDGPACGHFTKTIAKCLGITPKPVPLVQTWFAALSRLEKEMLYRRRMDDLDERMAAKN